MKYIRYVGSKWVQVFAIDKQNTKSSLIEIRYRDEVNGMIDGVILDCSTSILGTFDLSVVNSLIECGETITQVDWNKYKKVVQAYLTQMNE